MTTVAELDRVQTLVNRLNVLANVQRGDVIRAQQWNDFVSIVTSLAQAFLTAQHDETVPPHEHPDQVAVAWLDPSLRSLIEKGPLADPVATSRYVDIDRRVRQLVTDLESVRDAASSARDRLAEMSSRELVRDASITEIRRVVDAIDSRKDAITEMRATLASIRGSLDQALEIGSHLTVNGVPVDMAQIDQRIRSVEDLRTKLTLANGQVLDGHEFESRIADLQNKVVTQDQLDKALKERQVEIPQETLDRLKESVSTNLRQEFTTSFDKLRTDIAAQTDTRLSGVDTTIVQRIDDRLPAAVGAAMTTIRAEIASTADQVRKDSQAFANQSATAAASALRQELTPTINAIQSGLPASINAALDNALSTRLADIQTGLAAARADAASALAKLDSQAADVSAVRARVEQVALQDDAAVKKMRESLIAEMNTRDAANRQDVDNRFKDFDAHLDARIDDRLKNRVGLLQTDLTAQLQQIATDTAASAVKSASTQLRAEFTNIARDQAAAIQDQVRSAVVADLDTKISNSVANEVKRQRLTPIHP